MTGTWNADDVPTISPLGDDALLVTFARAISWDVGARVRATAGRIRERLHAMNVESVTEVVPAYTTLAVYFDSARMSFDSVASLVTHELDVTDRERDAPRDAPRDAQQQDGSALVEIPVRYDGPDLADVAERTGLTIDDVIERHCTRTYRAYMSGFVPGFVYLGDLDESLVLPRRAVPRVRVPAGSVAIAGAQTAVYPLETPGGWHLIGTTSAVLFDAERDPPALIRAGDTVRFIRVTR
jgi:KipI family sensor histidine kinase inhibitor